MVWIMGAAILLILGGVYWVYRRRQNKPMYCIVWLLASPRHLTLEMMAELLRKVTGLPFGTDENSSYSVVGDANHMMFIHENGAYLINNLPHPYMEPEEKYLQEIRDLRLRNALAAHQAWLSVDYLPLKKNRKFDTANIYPFLGKLAAELYKEDCLAIYFTENHINLPAEPWVLEALRSESPVETILEKYKEEANPEVIEIESGSEEMKKAVAEARARWPEFAEAFRSRGLNDHYAAKFPFSDGENEEFMWISVEDIQGETLCGSLDNEPVQLKNVQVGDRVKVSLKDINDWMIMKDDEIKGGFTVKVLQKAGSE